MLASVQSTQKSGRCGLMRRGRTVVHHSVVTWMSGDSSFSISWSSIRPNKKLWEANLSRAPSSSGPPLVPPPPPPGTRSRTPSGGNLKLCSHFVFVNVSRQELHKVWFVLMCGALRLSASTETRLMVTKPRWRGRRRLFVNSPRIC